MKIDNITLEFDNSTDISEKEMEIDFIVEMRWKFDSITIVEEPAFDEDTVLDSVEAKEVKEFIESEVFMNQMKDLIINHFDNK